MTQPSLGPAVAALDTFVAARMAADGTPGLALAVTDRERPLHVATYGSADIVAGHPVAPETLFEIGSIGKSFTADALLILAERGAVDLDAPVMRYLTWFAVPSRFEPICLRHLLTHTAGIVAGPDGSPSGEGEVWLLRETEAATPPGERFHYSNVGYKVLGLVVAAVAGKPYPEAIRELLLGPLGMDATEPEITNDARSRLAVGYAGLYDDRTFHPRHPLVPATWLETDTGDGSLACPPADLAAYARMLLNRGRGPNGPVLSDAAFARKIGSPVETGWAHGHGYGFGIMVQRVDGNLVIGHTGVMVGYSAYLQADLDAGVGAVALVNGPGDPSAVVHYARALFTATVRGQELPPVPAVAEDLAPGLVGAYRLVEGSGPEQLHVEPDAATDVRLALRFDGERVPLELQWDDIFQVDHPTFARYRLVFARDEDGRAMAMTYGGASYVPVGVEAPAPTEVPTEWAGLLGRYRSHNPWCPYVEVVWRGGRLRLVFPTAPDGFEDEQPLVALDESGFFRAGEDAGGPERVRFDAFAEGKALRATLSGCPYWRV